MAVKIDMSRLRSDLAQKRQPVTAKVARGVVKGAPGDLITSNVFVLNTALHEPDWSDIHFYYVTAGKSVRELTRQKHTRRGVVWAVSPALPYVSADLSAAQVKQLRRVGRMTRWTGQPYPLSDPRGRD